MRQRIFLFLVTLALCAVPSLRAQWTLDPEPGYREFRPEAAVQADGSVLLTWNRQADPSADWTAMAATLDPGTGRIGEPHLWGDGGNEPPVSLGAGKGYVAVHQDFNRFFDRFAERLDTSGQLMGGSLALGYGSNVSVAALPGGGAILLLAGVSVDDGAVKAWKFGPDGSLLAGPVTLAAPSLWVDAGADAEGNLVLVWTDQGSRLFTRRFSPDLDPLGPEMGVALGGANSARVAVAPDGRFVVVYDQTGQLWSRAFRANGSPIGGRTLLSSRLDYVDGEDLDLAIAPTGKILLFWKVYENSNIPTLRARYIAFTGRPEGKLIRIAQIRGTNRGDLLRPRVEGLPAGDFLLLWTREDPTAEDLVLQGRRFR